MLAQAFPRSSRCGSGCSPRWVSCSGDARGNQLEHRQSCTARFPLKNGAFLLRRGTFAGLLTTEPSPGMILQAKDHDPYTNTMGPINSISTWKT